MSRKRMLRYLAISLVFVACGVFLVVSGTSFAWVVIAFFGIAVVVFGAEVASPSTLMLDVEGFSTRSAFRLRPFRRAWVDCGPFEAWSNGRLHLVVYLTEKNRSSKLRSLNEALSGGDESLRVGFGGLSAEQLATLMNRYRGERTALPQDH